MIRIVAAPVRPGFKTLQWGVLTERGLVGEIVWDAIRRCYVFGPEPRTVYEQDCLREIATFCEERTREHVALLIRVRKS